jgi:hypothetical protein
MFAYTINEADIMILGEHPTVQRFRATIRPGTGAPPQPLDAAWLRQLCRVAEVAGGLREAFSVMNWLDSERS